VRIDGVCAACAAKARAKGPSVDAKRGKP